MTSSSKWAAGGIVALVLAGAAWWYVSQNGALTAGNYSTQSTGTSTAPVSSTLPTSPGNTSDAALNQDTAAIDAQMNGLNSDSSSVNSSVNSSASGGQ